MINDWNLICTRKQQLIYKNTICQNQCSVSHDYKTIIQDLKKLSKLTPCAFGPFHVSQVHTNGTITIDHDNRLERINIPNVKPYY